MMPAWNLVGGRKKSVLCVCSDRGLGLQLLNRLTAHMALTYTIFALGYHGIAFVQYCYNAVNSMALKPRIRV